MCCHDDDQPLSDFSDVSYSSAVYLRLKRGEGSSLFILLIYVLMHLLVLSIAAVDERGAVVRSSSRLEEKGSQQQSKEGEERRWLPRLAPAASVTTTNTSSSTRAAVARNGRVGSIDRDARAPLLSLSLSLSALTIHSQQQ